MERGKERKRRSVMGAKANNLLYDKIWFGTEVWDEDGHDILRAYRVWGSVRSVIKS